jgi:hypothetical protein
VDVTIAHPRGSRGWFWHPPMLTSIGYRKLHARWRRERNYRKPGWPAVGIGMHWMFHWLRWVAIKMGPGFVGASP